MKNINDAFEFWKVGDQSVISLRSTFNVFFFWITSDIKSVEIKHDIDVVWLASPGLAFDISLQL